MRRRNRWDELRRLLRDDRGSAPLEFIAAGLLLLVPVVYLVVALGLIQHGTLGADAAARHAVRAIALSADDAEADRRAELVLSDIAREYGLAREDLAVEVTCPQEPGACPQAGATVVVTVRLRIPLPLVPPVLGLDEIAAVPIEAVAVQKASRTWGSGS